MLGYFYVFKIASMGTIFRMRNNLLSWTSSMNLGPSVARKLTNNQGIQEYLLSYCVFCQRWSHFEAKIWYHDRDPHLKFLFPCCFTPRAMHVFVSCWT